jgi:hypothetical protein
LIIFPLCLRAFVAKLIFTRMTLIMQMNTDLIASQFFHTDKTDSTDNIASQFPLFVLEPLWQN